MSCKSPKLHRFSSLLVAESNKPPQKNCDTVTKRKISPLTSITVHCSTTMASYIGMATFGSLSFASWKMKTLSTDLGSKSAEKKKKKKKKIQPWKRVFTRWSVSVLSLPCSSRPSRPEEMESYHSATFSHKPLYYIASGVGHLYEQCALIHYAGRQCKRKEQVFPFWDLKKEEETLCATSVVFRRQSTHCWFSRWKAK